MAGEKTPDFANIQCENARKMLHFSLFIARIGNTGYRFGLGFRLGLGFGLGLGLRVSSFTLY